MANKEHQIFGDIPNNGKNRYHSAILTTYSVDLIHFDSQDLSLLHQKHISSINMLVDRKQLDRAMADVDSAHINHIGQEYSVSSVPALGAFHPKINFFLGENCALAIFGSGNITVPGHGKNHELFTGLMIESDFDEEDGGRYMLLQECWQYVKRFAENADVYTKRRVCKELPAHCSVIEDDGFITEENRHALYVINDHLSAALLYNEENSGILMQAIQHIPLNEVKKITVVSPFYDEDGATLLTIAELCPNAKVEVLIQAKCMLPPNKMHEQRRVQFYDFDQTERGKQTLTGNKGFERRLHAKLIHFEIESGEYCIMGSANATVPGFGTVTNRGANDEFCILYYSETVHFLKELGLQQRKELKKAVSEMERQSETEDREIEQIKVHIDAALYHEGRLTLELGKNKFDGCLSVMISTGAFINQTLSLGKIDQQKVAVDISLGKGISSCVLIDENSNFVSNYCFINSLENLEYTNPSRENQEINKVIAKIENEGYHGMEITEMLSDMMRSVTTNREQTIIQITGSGNSASVKSKRIAQPELKYNSSYDNETATELSINVQSGAASRLLDCIEDNIRQGVRTIEEVLKAEENDADSTKSNERKVDVLHQEHITQKVAKTQPRRVGDLLLSYEKLRKVRTKQILSTHGEVTQDDLIFFALTMFASTELCYLNQSRYTFGDEDSGDPWANESISQAKSDFLDSLRNTMLDKGVMVLNNFAIFCQQVKPKQKADAAFVNKAQKVLRYVLIFGYLFFKNVTEAQQNYYGWRVELSLINLFQFLGLPDLKELRDELTPISEKYDHEFRVDAIILFVESLISKYADKKAYPKDSERCRGIVRNKRAEWLRVI